MGNRKPALLKTLSFALVVWTVGIGTALAATALTVESFSLREFSIPAVELPPAAIVTAPRGSVWFSEEAGLRIGELSAKGTYRLFNLHNAPSQIQNLALAQDGTLWFTETSTADGSHNLIGKIRRDGSIATYPLDRSGAFLSSVVAAKADGVWVSEMDASRVARVTNSGKIREFVLPGPRDESARSLVRGSDDSVWVAQDHAIVHLYPTGRAQRFPVRTPRSGDGIRNMVRATENSFWMTLYTQRGGPEVIWRFIPPGSMTPFPYPGPAVGAIVLVSANDGGAWFTDLGARSFYHIDAIGRVERHLVPLLGSDIEGMALSSTGGLWFTNMQSEKLGYFGTGQAAPSAVIPPLPARDKKIVEAWQRQLEPRASYNMSNVTADTLSVASDFAVVGWSDLDGNAATLLRNDKGGWKTVFVTNGNFYQMNELTKHGVPQSIATQLLRDENVRLVPGSRLYI